jgi:pimeloyl-ACP methyl ester carboxylesterase
VKKIPTLFVFGVRDALIPAKVFYKIASNQFDVAENDVFQYDADLQPLTQGKETWIKVIALEKGGHMAFRKYAEFVHAEIEKLLLKASL